MRIWKQKALNVMLVPQGGVLSHFRISVRAVLPGSKVFMEMFWERLAALLLGLPVPLTLQHLIFASGVDKGYCLRSVIIHRIARAWWVGTSCNGYSYTRRAHKCGGLNFIQYASRSAPVPSLNVCRLLSLGHKNLII